MKFFSPKHQTLFFIKQIMDSLLKKLHDFRNEAINVKNDQTPGNPWGEDEDRHMRNLELWIRIAETEAETGIEYFQQSPMFRHDSFKDFLSSYSYEWASFYGKAGNKIKTSRATSKVSICPRCESMTRVEEDQCICTNSKCGYSWRITPSISKTAVDPMKHTKNKIEMLIGTKHPPRKIVDLLPQISIWLTDLNYLYDWLRYKDQNIVQKDSISFDEWMFELKRIYKPKDTTRKWSMIIPQEPRYAWTFLEFKLIISEMSGMLSECIRRSSTQFTSSNMKNLNEDMIIKIAEAYIAKQNPNSSHTTSMKLNTSIDYDDLNIDDLDLDILDEPNSTLTEWKPKLPKKGEVFEYNGKFWDIGNYINMLALEFIETPIKTKLSDMFKEKIRMPGLMFPFDWNDPCSYVPEKHVFTEAYSFCIHECFKMPYTIIPVSDIQKIIKIIEMFDQYVHNCIVKNNPNPTKKINSMLYSCKLFFIFSLPYFYKYHEVCNYIPVKSRETTGSIRAWWNKFSTDVKIKDFLAPYKVKTEEPKISSESILQAPSRSSVINSNEMKNDQQWLNVQTNNRNEFNPNDFQYHRQEFNDQNGENINSSDLDDIGKPQVSPTYDDLFGDLI